jgi:hypothetical protein
MTTRPDSFACCLAAVGLTRAIRNGKVDALSAVLLVLAPWLKPTLLGLPAGALLADAFLRRTPRMLALASVVCVGIGVVLYVASSGLIFDHVIRSNAQPFTLAGWSLRIAHHLPFFGPLFVLALWQGAANRRHVGTAIGLAATIGAIGWTLVAIAKTGASANYWMEPCIAAVALVAHAPGPYAFGRSGLVHAALTLLAVIYTDVASIRTSFERIALYRHDAAVVASVRRRCEASPSDVIASDEQGIELAVNGRILTTAYQIAWRVNAGKYPASLYIADLLAPNVRCFVIHSHELHAAPEVERSVGTHFTTLFTDGDVRVLKRR